MKKITLSLMLLLTSSAFADVRVGINILSPELRQCRHENVRLQTRLESCQASNRGGNYQLRQENRELRERNQYLNSEVTRLSDEVYRLQRQLDDLTRPEPRGHYNRLESFRACDEITSSSSARNCKTYAQQYEVNAQVISECAKITSSSSAANCVAIAGQNNVYAAQVYQCVRITSPSSAVNCVLYAGQKQVRPEEIQYCVESETMSSSQANCVARM